MLKAIVFLNSCVSKDIKSKVSNQRFFLIEWPRLETDKQKPRLIKLTQKHGTISSSSASITGIPTLSALISDSLGLARIDLGWWGFRVAQRIFQTHPFQIYRKTNNLQKN